MKRKIGQILQFNVAIPFWLILAMGVGVAIAIYFVAPKYREDVKFITVVIGGATAIYSAYYVGAGLRLNIERQKQEASFEILSLLNRPEFVEVRQFLGKEVEGHEKLSESDLYDKITSNTKLENAVSIVLGILEDASIAIQYEYVSETVLYTSISDLVRRNFRGLRGYINQARKQKSVPSAYLEVERLHNAWTRAQRLSDGRPLPQISAA